MPNSQTEKDGNRRNIICRLFSLVHDVPLDFGFSGVPCLMIASWYLFIPFFGGHQEVSMIMTSHQLVHLSKKNLKNNLKPWKGDGWEIMIWYSFRTPILMVWQDEVIRINHPKVINCYDRVSLKLNQPGVYDILRYCYRLGITFPTWYIPERGIADLVRGFSYCVGWFAHGA